MFLLVLSLCGFASAMSGRILDPVITDIAGDFGARVATVALLSTAYAVPFAVAQPVLGPLGDLFSKTLIVKASVGLLTVFSVVAALAPTLDLLFVARILAGAAGAGVVPIGFALIGDRVHLSGRQLAISRFVAATLLGQLLGASVAGILAHAFGWRGVLWFSAAITLAITAAAVVMLPHNATRRDQAGRREPARIAMAVANYRAVLRNPLSYVCFGVVIVEGICIHGSLPFIGEYLHGLGKGGVREAGIVISGMAIGGLVFAFGVPLFLRFLQRRQMMGLGGVFGGLGLACIALGTDWPVEALFMAITGFGFFLLHNPVQTEVSELAPSARASAYSLHAFSFYTGQAIGPVLYGLGLHTIGLSASFAVAGLCFLATGLSAFRLLRTPG
ncbi:MAG TPA: MFS transporter [Stellaceae bacterium]|nr:MFS transporter [Stellaceae bacterium]